MPDLTVNIQTPSGFEVQGALIPDNITVQQVIAELLGGLSLPRLANGQPINYSLVLVNRGLVLQGDQTLQDGGVQYGDTIRLVTGAEPSNGSHAPRPADPGRNGDSAWQPAPTPAAQPAPPVAAPTSAPGALSPGSSNDWSSEPLPVNSEDWPLSAAPASANDWPRDGAPARANEWPRDAVPAISNDWPRDGGALVSDDWPGDSLTAPAFEPAQGTPHSFAMADAVKAGAEPARDSSTAVSHIEIDGGWTANELSEWLGKLELAYSRINGFLCLSDEDITRAASGPDNKAARGSMEDSFRLLVAAASRRSSNLTVERINFAAEGSVELTGDQPPIKIMTESINGWRQRNLTGGNGSRPDAARQAGEAVAALTRRVEQLSAQGGGVFVEGFIHYAIDEAMGALEAMAKDIRIRRVSWSSDSSRP